MQEPCEPGPGKFGELYVGSRPQLQGAFSAEGFLLAGYALQILR